uniref:Transmembrane protein n=1 Tax=Rhabditophanes sp. KR3021 TaxID=114890 RepID=A0AC35TL90_9BILA
MGGGAFNLKTKLKSQLAILPGLFSAIYQFLHYYLSTLFLLRLLVSIEITICMAVFYHYYWIRDYEIDAKVGASCSEPAHLRRIQLFVRSSPLALEYRQSKDYHLYCTMTWIVSISLALVSKNCVVKVWLVWIVVAICRLIAYFKSLGRLIFMMDVLTNYGSTYHYLSDQGGFVSFFAFYHILVPTILVVLLLILRYKKLEIEKQRRFYMREAEREEMLSNAHIHSHFPDDQKRRRTNVDESGKKGSIIDTSNIATSEDSQLMTPPQPTTPTLK